MPEPPTPPDRDPVDELAEEFADRLRRGEHPSIDEYVQQHQQWAERIQQVFSALVVIERLKPGPDDGMAAGEADSTSTPLQTPERMGDYRILREVGRGGMGVVYEAEQTSLGRHVALKVLQSSAVLDPKHIARFERESRAAAQLHHTNIVPVFGVGHEGHLHYYVMQFIQGQPLDDVLDELKWLRKQQRSEDLAQEDRDRSGAAQIAVGLLSGQFEAASPGQTASEPASNSSQDLHGAPELPDDSSAVLPGEHEISSVTHSDVAYWHCAARVGLQVADALEYAHEQGILHRDIKPANLLLDHHGTVWVTDFGLARVAEDDNLTQTGDVVGTLRYMPPEAFRGKFDASSDIFGLGLVLYEMLALRPAFDAVDRSSLMHQVSMGEISPLRKVNPGVPRDLETIVMKAVEQEPAHRYASGKQMAEDLQRFLEDKPIRARRAGSVERAWRWSRRNPALAASLAAVSALLVFLAVAGQLMAERERLARENTRQLLYVSDMNSAAEAWENADLARVYDLLDRHRNMEHPDGFHGFEWNLLWEKYLSTQRHTRLRHNDGVRSAVFSSDGKTLITATKDTIRFWDVAARKVVASHTGGEFRSLVLSPDGKTLALGKKDGSVVLWDFATRQKRDNLELDPYDAGISQLAFSADNKTLVGVGFGSKSLKLWDVDSGNVVHQEIGDASFWGLSAVFSTDSSRLAVGSYGSVHLWDLADPYNEETLRYDGSNIRCVIVSPDGTLLAIGGDESVVRLHDLAQNQQRTLLEGHLAPIYAGAFSPDGRLFASGSEDRTVRLWDVETGQEVAVLRGHTQNVMSLAFSPDGRSLASGGGDSEVILWDVDRPDPGRLKLHQAPVTGLAISQDATKLASVSFLGHPALVLWDVATGRGEPLIEGGDLETKGVALSPTENTLVAVIKSSLKIWDLDTRDVIERNTGDYRISGLLFSPDGKLLATPAGRIVRIWNTETWNQIAEVEGPNFSSIHVAFSPCGRFFATPTGHNMVTLYDTKSWKKTSMPTKIQHHWPIRGVAFSPNSDRLATVCQEGQIRLWDLGTFRQEFQDMGATSGLYCVAFSPDGKALVTGGVGGRINVWKLNLKKPELVTTLRGHGSSIRSVVFSADGRIMATASFDGTVRLWRTTNEGDIERIVEKRG